MATVAVMACGAFGACATAAPETRVAPVVPVDPATAQQARDDAAAHWEARADEGELRAAIAAWSRAAPSRPDDLALAESLARAHYTLAEGHLVFRKDDDPHAAEAYVGALDACAATAEAALAARWPDFGERRRLDVPFADAIALVDARAAPLLYWWSQCRMFAANARGLGATIAAHQVVFAVMTRVAADAPDYWHAGADRYFGVIYAAAPAIAGGDRDRSRAHFDAALARAPGFLETRLLYAMFHSDRAMLAAVARGDGADGDPAIAPEQRIARRKAELLLGVR